MNGTIFLAIFLTAALATFAATNNTAAKVTLPPKDKLQVYLLMGQSNMAGRGAIGEEDKITHPRVLMWLTNGTWQLAVNPIVRDRKSGLGVGPGFSFGKAMAEANPGIVIGLVPCAVGGTPLSRWQKGGDLYQNALVRARSAMKDGNLKGIIWHQGESDTGQWALADTYSQRLNQMVRDFRADLGMPGLPFVAGKLGEFFHAPNQDVPPFSWKVNEALGKLPENTPFTACVESKGLGHLGDDLHFNSAAQREFGGRYAAAMLRLQSTGK